MKRTAAPVTGTEQPVTVSRWSRIASGFTGMAVVAVGVLAAVPYFAGGPAEQPLITLLTFVAMASQWNLLAGFSGLTSVFSIQYSVDMLFMVLIGGMGTIEGPVLGALVLFGLQEALSSYGAWYLVIVGGLAVTATLIASRGLWGFVADRYGWSLLPVGYRVHPPRPPHPPHPDGHPRG
jgi:ABC-type branched-subunit amino acid transport system permease subunit